MNKKKGETFDSCSISRPREINMDINGKQISFSKIERRYNEMLYVIMVVLYMVIGYGAMWLANRQNNKYMDKLFTEFEDTDYRGVMKYLERKNFRKASNWMHKMNYSMVIFLSIAVWVLWPITVVFTTVFNYVSYEETFDEGKRLTN